MKGMAWALHSFFFEAQATVTRKMKIVRVSCLSFLYLAFTFSTDDLHEVSKRQAAVGLHSPSCRLGHGKENECCRWCSCRIYG